MSDLASKPIFRHGGWLAKLEALHHELFKYRDFAPIAPAGSPTSGKILPFVKGLYLSARLIYVIREIVKSKNYEVNWGHVMHQSGVYCSPECDIIIHRQTSSLIWNGGVLNFHFVDVSAVVAVISCKSIVSSIDAEYAKELKGFGVGTVALIGEVCSESNFGNLQTKAIELGYADFWCLAVEKGEARIYDENMLMRFINFLEGL